MKKIKKLNNKGFAMTGVLYMSLLIFLILIVSLLTMFLSRKNVLDKLKNNAIAAVTPYPVYYNGMTVYYNPETGLKCTEEEYNNNSDKLGKTGCLKWYTFNDNDSSPTVNMILDHNTTAAIAWNSTGSNTEMKDVKDALENDTTTWNSDVKTTARLITADEIAKITSNIAFNQTTTDRTGWFYFDSNDQNQTSTSQGASKYAWLFDYTNGCISYGCNIEDSNSVGYWTSNVILDTSRIWYIRYSGNLGTEDVSTNVIGVRPVITVSKASISYPKYDNGAIVYFDPNTGLECTESDYTANSNNLQNSGCMKWYIFNDTSNSSNVNMILDHNTTSAVAWNLTGTNTEMKDVKEALESNVSSWNDNIKNTARLIQANEIAKITGNTTFDQSMTNLNGWFYLEDNSQNVPSLNQGESKYSWLFDYTNECIDYGCSISSSLTDGYWTATPVAGSGSNAWRIGKYGNFNNHEVSNSAYSGVRPVITVSKSLLTNVIQATKFGYTTDNLVVHLDGLIAPVSDVWKDQSGNGNNASLLNMNNTSTSGYQSDGVLLDGVDDDFNINLKNTIAANSSITIQVIFTNYDLTKRGVLGATSDWGKFMSHIWDNNGNFYIGTKCLESDPNGSRFTPTDINYQIPANTLIKFTYIYNGDTKKARLIISTVDGKKVDVEKTFNEGPDAIDSFQTKLGTALSNNKYNQILIYNRALTDAEIEKNYEVDKIRFGI